VVEAGLLESLWDVPRMAIKSPLAIVGLSLTHYVVLLRSALFSRHRMF
jgi:hypothetical protein